MNGDCRNDESLAGEGGTTESGPPPTTGSSSAGPPARSTGNEQLQEHNGKICNSTMLTRTHFSASERQNENSVDLHVL